MAAKVGIEQAKKHSYPIPRWREHWQKKEPPSAEFVEYLCWGSAGVEAWVQNTSRLLNQN